MEVLKRWALPEVPEMVERYWADPETHFDEMIKMVFNFMKCTYRDLGDFG
jgi:hypothetical protein